ncbi:MAG: Fur family transcriptional regulator [Leptospiraceae bacterium]|nr:Fur family transcriptional regulator [Leptospiraceae bacterium]
MKTENAIDIKEILKNNNLKITKSRIAVLELLSESSKPITHSEIMENLADAENWDRVTIYRTLGEFEEKKIVKTILSNDRVTYFELQDSLHEHAHLSCDSCGKMTCLNKEQFHFSIGEIVEFKLNRVEILLKGICKNCQ